MKKLIIITVLTLLAVPAQANLTDHSIFGANYVNTGTNVQIHGLVGSSGYINLGGGSTLFDGACAGTYFTSGTNINTASGTDIIANTTIYLGGGANIGGNAKAGTNITGGTNVHVIGSLIAGGTATLGGGSTWGAKIEGMVPAPSYTPPSIPDPTPFTAGGTNQNVAGGGSLTLAPGVYGTLSTGSNATLNLSSGTYYFDAINTIGGGSQVYLDLTSGDILIYVLGNFSSGTNVDFNLTGGSAKDIYIETHGDFSWGGGGWLYGTVFAPGGTVTLGESDIDTGSNVHLYGAFYGDDVVTLGGGTIVNFEVSDVFDQMVNPVNPIPAPGAVLLGSIGVGLVGWLRRRGTL